MASGGLAQAKAFTMGSDVATAWQVAPWTRRQGPVGGPAAGARRLRAAEQAKSARRRARRGSPGVAARPLIVSATGRVRDGSWEQDPSLLRATHPSEKSKPPASVDTLHGPPAGGVRKGQAKSCAFWSSKTTEISIASWWRP